MYKNISCHYRRSSDDILLTWNQSKEKLVHILQIIHRQYPHVQMELTINNMNIHYLDIDVSHFQDKL